MSVRVMVVEDSNFMRRAIARLLASHNDIEEVSSVGSGEEAIKKLAEISPDVITLDFEMPGMDGLTTLEKIMNSRPTPVVMLSAYTEKGADTALKALRMGAVDVVRKPSGSISLDLRKVREELISAILTAAKAGPAIRRAIVKRTETAHIATTTKLANSDRSLLFIASSTGGVQALSKVIPLLPADFPMPVLVVQHMPPKFTRSLAASLNDISLLQVKEAEEGDILVAGMVFVAPGGMHTKVVKVGRQMKISLDSEPSETILKPCADVTMNTIADSYGGDSISLILTGMGDDGTKGAVNLKSRGGTIIAQDELTSTIFGMPRSVIEAGVADAVLPIDRIADHIKSLV